MKNKFESKRDDKYNFNWCFIYDFFAKEIIVIMAAKEFHSSLSIIPWIIVGNVFLFLHDIFSICYL